MVFECNSEGVSERVSACRCICMYTRADDDDQPRCTFSKKWDMWSASSSSAPPMADMYYCRFYAKLDGATINKTLDGTYFVLLTFVEPFHNELPEPKTVRSDCVADSLPPPVALQLFSPGVFRLVPISRVIEPGAPPQGQRIKLVDGQALQKGLPPGCRVNPCSVQHEALMNNVQRATRVVRT